MDIRLYRSTITRLIKLNELFSLTLISYFCIKFVLSLQILSKIMALSLASKGIKKHWLLTAFLANSIPLW
jgi:hypothetical protein